MQSVKALIDEAALLCKTKRALASRLETTEQTIQAIHKGRRHMTTQQCALLAEVLGRDARDVLALSEIEREKDRERQARLREAFFRRAIAGGVAFITISGSVLPDEPWASQLDRIAQNIHCRACKLVRAVHRRLRACLARALILAKITTSCDGGSMNTDSRPTRYHALSGGASV